MVLRPILDGVADVVYGSRFLGTHRSFMLHHYLGNRFLSLVTNVLYNNMLTDMETGYKAFRAPIIKSLRIRSNRGDFEPEITAKVRKRGYRIYEVPIYCAGRNYAAGKKITYAGAACPCQFAKNGDVAGAIGEFVIEEGYYKQVGVVTP